MILFITDDSLAPSEGGDSGLVNDLNSLSSSTSDVFSNKRIEEDINESTLVEQNVGSFWEIPKIENLAGLSLVLF